jgi:hypothetical protein
MARKTINFRVPIEYDARLFTPAALAQMLGQLLATAPAVTSGALGLGLVQPEVTAQCEDCDRVWTQGNMNALDRLLEQITPPLDPVPVGMCPACGGLCYVRKDAD